MTTPIDPVERRLPEALTDLASPRTPDYFIDILGQTARVRQRPAWVRPGRWIGMNGFLGRPQLVAVAVVLVAIVGGGMLLMQRNQAQIGGSPASPAPSSASSPAPSAPAALTPTMPAAFLNTWMGPSRDVPGLGRTTRMQIIFKVGLAWVSGTQLGFTTHLTSYVDASTDTMRLTLQTDEAGCTAGAVGDYTWSLSSGGRKLTLAATSDPCAARAAAMLGTWFREACTDTTDGCFGDLDPGTYPSQYIAPRRAVSDAWEPNWGALTYTVPAGWSNSQDWPNEFSLTPSEDYAHETADGPAAGASHEIWTVVAPRANKVTSDCGRAIDASVAGTVDGLMAWIAKQPALTSSTPVAITIDGHPGKWVDIRIAPTWTTTCTGGTGRPERAYFAYPSATADDAWMAGLAGQERCRIILLDLGGGQTIGILIDAGDPATFDDLVNRSLPIIQSFKFQ